MNTITTLFKRVAHINFVFIAFFLFTFGACEKQPTIPFIPAPIIEDPNEIDKVIYGIPKLNLTYPDDGYLGKRKPIESTQLNTFEDETGEYVIKKTKYNITQNFGEIIHFSAYRGTIWEGAPLQGEKLLKDGLPSLIALNLQPLEIFTTLEIDSNHTTVNDPHAATINQARTKLISKFTGTIPALYSFQKTEAYNVRQMMLEMGISIDAYGLSVVSKFNVSSSDTKSSLFINLIQDYYSMHVRPKSRPSLYFSNIVTQPDLNIYMGLNNPPLYVEGITYGRRIMIMMSSRYSHSEMIAAFQFKYKKKLGNFNPTEVQGYAERKLNQIDSSSTFQVLIIGGSAIDAARYFTKEELASLIENGANFTQDSPGAPISYKVHYLSDSTPALFGQTTEFEVLERKPAIQEVEVSVDKVYVQHDCDAGKGAFVYKFWVEYGNETKIIDERREPIKIGDGEWLNINKKAYINLDKTKGSSFTLRGNITEKDDGGFIDGDDDHFKAINERFEYKVGEWKKSGQRNLNINGSKCKGDFYYTVTFK